MADYEMNRLFPSFTTLAAMGIFVLGTLVFWTLVLLGLAYVTWTVLIKDTIWFQDQLASGAAWFVHWLGSF